MRTIATYLVLCLLFFTACHSSKKVVSEKDIKQFENIALYDSISKNYGDFKTVKFGFALDVKEAKALPQVKGNFRIQKDSIIWIGVSAMSIDIFRAVITQDSIKCYSKMQKMYYTNSLDSLSSITGLTIDYKTIESVLLDEMFFCQQSNFDTVDVFKSLDINKKDNKIILQNHSKKDFKKNDTLSLLQTWQVLTDNFRINEVEITEENLVTDGVKIKLSYTDYETFQSISFPTSLVIKAKLPNKKLHVDVKYSKVNFNEDLSFPFNPNSSYQKFDLK